MADDNFPEGGSPPTSDDPFGIKPYGETIAELSKTATAFIRAIGLPACTQIGELLGDEIRFFREKRKRNAELIAEGARRLIGDMEPGQLRAQPRIIHQVLEIGSWSDEDEMQRLWSGLLASACTPDGLDDSNIPLTQILSQLTLAQVRLIHYVCDGIRGKPELIRVLADGGGGRTIVKESILQEKMKLGCVDDVRREVEILRQLCLVSVFDHMPRKYLSQEDVTPSRLAMQLYMRCQGARGPLEDFYRNRPVETANPGV